MPAPKVIKELIGRFDRNLATDRSEHEKIAFAQRFGLSRHNIANYELGRCDIPTRILANLDKMGLNPGWLLNNRGEMFYEGGY